MPSTIVKKAMWLLCLQLAAAAQSGFAQEFPARQISIIVPTAPSPGGPDLTARLIAPGMSKALGQPVIVENKTGASGLIAYEYVAKQAQPDGYTLLLGNPPLVALHLFVKDLKFSVQKDLAPASLLMEGVTVMASSPAAPWKDYREMVRYAKANPGKVNFGTAGVQTAAALILEAIKQKNGIDIVNIPFKGGSSEARPALLSNTIQLAWYTESLAYADGDRVRILAVAGERHMKSLPQAPTFTELGEPGIPGSGWYALLAPAGTPRSILLKINAAAMSALQQPETQQIMAKNGLYDLNDSPSSSSPETASRFIETQLRIFTDVATKAGIKPQ